MIILGHVLLLFVFVWFWFVLCLLDSFECNLSSYRGWPVQAFYYLPNIKSVLYCYFFKHFDVSVCLILYAWYWNKDWKFKLNWIKLHRKYILRTLGIFLVLVQLWTTQMLLTVGEFLPNNWVISQNFTLCWLLFIHKWVCS